MQSIDPPGTILCKAVFSELAFQRQFTTFLEIGCGDGKFSEILCKSGKTGSGIDFSIDAVRETRKRMDSYIKKQQYQVYCLDVMENAINLKADLVFSMFVMEHIPDDRIFLLKLKNLVNPGGSLIIMVPGRTDKWGIEDETVGHLRRYSRDEIIQKCHEAGLKCQTVWSLGVPLTNVLLKFSNITIRAAGGAGHRSLPTRIQTETSGVRQIPYKTMFPSFFRFFFNDVALYPFIILQRLFFNTDLGLMIVATAIPDSPASNAVNKGSISQW